MNTPDDQDLTPPEMPLAFDSDNRPVPVVHPIFEQADEGQDDAGQRREIIAGLLRLLSTGNPGCAGLGRRLLVTAYLTGSLPECKTHKQLATRLNVTPGRVSQIISEIKGVLPSLAKCKNRQSPKN